MVGRMSAFSALVTSNRLKSLITNDIRVTVAPRFEPDYSDLSSGRYVFSYRIEIENLSGRAVQLLYRHWNIVDSSGMFRKVQGEGVVGQQPVLQPGESYEYMSWCPIHTPIGTMEGTFEMQYLGTNVSFDVKVPRFALTAPFVLN